MASNSIFRRYSREILVKEIGIKGLRKLRSSKVTIVGCGALGFTEAELLVKAGVKMIKVIDRDYVDTELHIE